MALAEENDEMLLAARIRNHVRLVNLQAGRLEIGLTGNAPETLVGDLAKQLSLWTDKRWFVSLSDKHGMNTLAQEAAESDTRMHDTIAKDQLVTKIMEVFPGASIDAIKPAASPEASLKNDNDTASVSNEKSSG